MNEKPTRVVCEVRTADVSKEIPVIVALALRHKGFDDDCICGCIAEMIRLTRGITNGTAKLEDYEKELENGGLE